MFCHLNRRNCWRGDKGLGALQRTLQVHRHVCSSVLHAPSDWSTVWGASRLVLVEPIGFFGWIEPVVHVSESREAVCPGASFPRRAPLCVSLLAACRVASSPPPQAHTQRGCSATQSYSGTSWWRRHRYDHASKTERLEDTGRGAGQMLDRALPSHTSG